MIDDEIDLRQSVQGVLRYWPLILALTLIAAVGAVVISLGQKDAYEAVALISVSAPRYNLQPDGASPNGPLPVRAYPELAASGDVLTQVLSQSQSLLPGANLTALQARLTAEAASDPTLVRLKAYDGDPQIAAKLANIWADVFATHAGSLYGQDQANLQLYTGQLADAKTALDKPESDLAGFQSTNQVTLLTAQLDSQKDSLTDYLNRRHGLELLSRDARDLVDHLSALSPSAPASPEEDLALLAITGRIYGSTSTITGSQPSAGQLPVQVQLAAGQGLAGPAVADQLALASSLRATIAARLADIDGQVGALQPQILALQGQLAEAQLKENELGRVRDLAGSDYNKLASLVQDAKLVAQASSNTVQIASRAVVPTLKISTHRSNTILIAGALGLVTGVVLALAISLWRGSPAALASYGNAAGPAPVHPAPSNQGP